MVASEEITLTFALNKTALDLREVFSEEELKKHEENIVYAPQEESQEMYPCALRLEEGTGLYEEGTYSSPVCVSIPVQSINIEEAADFMLYLSGKN